MLSLYLVAIDDHHNDSKFEELYYKYRNMMFSVAFGILKNENLAEDAVQDAFLSIAKNIGRIKTDNEKMTSSYIYTITKNAAYKVYNAENESKIVDVDLLCDAASEYDLEELTIKGERYRKIVKIILSLPHIYLDTLSLYYVHGFNSREISDMLGIPKSTVKSRLKRGNDLLAYKLSEVKDEE